MAGCIIEEEKTLHMSVSAPLKYFDRTVYLGKQVSGCEPAIPVLPRPEYYLSFTVQGCVNVRVKKLLMMHLSSSHRGPHLEVRKSDTMRVRPSPFGLGVTFLPGQPQ